MDILVVVSDMELGGITTSVVNFCNELNKRNENVTILNIGIENKLYENRLNRNVKKIDLPKNRKIWKLNRSYLDNKGLFKKIILITLGLLKKILNLSNKWISFCFFNYSIKQVFDVAIAFRQNNECYYFVLNCTKAKSKIAFVHGEIDSMGDCSSFDKYLNEFDSVNCVSRACMNGFKNRYPQISSRFKFVYNMFDVDEIKKMALVEPTFSINENIFSIVTVSRIKNWSKGTERILEICKLLKTEGFSFVWYVVGDGPDYLNNKKQVKDMGLDNILIYLGKIDNPYSIVKRCNLSVLPTRGEAFSMSIIESQILGTPIVVSKYKGIDEAINDGMTGLISEQSIDDIFLKIKDCILNKNSILTNMKQCLFNFTYDNNIAYSQFLESIVRK